ncbi:hypothetical protein A2W14_04865 [Candidatus Gottesmanbacteria bacterium RBG_16_37_8]|uniref:Rhodanese domain-containing protein n=1 Tax=Candidatus Gottesmanbacteria bacterium RBG_16_37_8 TaxID=1798371 RepID=A0A1F5YUR7_9BACT|nr:MAG: hypothetical protein A2W14_04865 [Candidatus Gottesmanbacteria bacterium RBG_16_37_8]
MNKIVYITLLSLFLGGWLYIYKIHRIPTEIKYTDITSNQLKTMLQKKDFYFVNVHVPYEGEIEKTDAFIPYNEIEKNLEKLPKDKNAKIVLYCRSGRMSTIAAKRLTELGYTNIGNLLLGMHDWQSKGYSLLKN